MPKVRRVKKPESEKQALLPPEVCYAFIEQSVVEISRIGARYLVANNYQPIEELLYFFINLAAAPAQAPQFLGERELDKELNSFVWRILLSMDLLIPVRRELYRRLAEEELEETETIQKLKKFLTYTNIMDSKYFTEKSLHRGIMPDIEYKRLRGQIK